VQMLIGGSMALWSRGWIARLFGRLPAKAGMRHPLLGPVPLTVGLVLATVAVLFFRRPDQFLHPYIWVEEGQYVLREYLEGGLWVLAKPMSGYLQLASKIIAYVAFRTSILHAPEIAIVLTVAFTASVIVAVALCPTHLKWRPLCALGILLIPADSEVFAVSSYAFWWAGILLLLSLLWEANRGRQRLRWVFILFGGLSSPLAVTLVPLFLLRTAIERRRSEYIAGALAFIVAVAQVLAMYQQHLPVSIESFSIRLVPIGLEKFVGAFFYNGATSLFPGIFIAILLLVAAWLVRSRLDRYFLLLSAIYGVICVSVSARMPIGSLAGIDPFLVGPRYFFYPFILISWIMIWLAAVSPQSVRAGVAAAFVCSLVFSWHGLTRHHDSFDWRANILACATQSGDYEIPIHYIGEAKEMWHAKFAGDECRILLQRSLF
jgi:hypothetical protein